MKNYQTHVATTHSVEIKGVTINDQPNYCIWCMQQQKGQQRRGVAMRTCGSRLVDYQHLYMCMQKSLESLENDVLVCNFSNSQLMYIPIFIQDLTSLQSLNLQGTYIRKFPPMFMSKNLQHLSICKTWIGDLSPLEKFANLMTLDASCLNYPILNNLPRLDNIVDLNLSFNDLSDVYLNFEKYKFLKALNIEGCKLSFIPYNIGKCVELVYLNMANNNFSIISPDISNLVKLDTLFLGLRPLKMVQRVMDFLVAKQFAISLQWTVVPDINEVNAPMIYFDE